MKRKSLSTRLRFEIFKRDGFKCQYCGETPPRVILHVDHILAISDGGTSESSNLITACSDCNLGKAAVPLDKHVDSLDNVRKIEAKRLEQLRQYNRWLADKLEQDRAWFKSISDSWLLLIGDDPNEYVISGERAGTIRMFLRFLPANEIISSLYAANTRIHDASSRSFFKYFCGVCWRKIKEAR